MVTWICHWSRTCDMPNIILSCLIKVIKGKIKARNDFAYDDFDHDNLLWYNFLCEGDIYHMNGMIKDLVVQKLLRTPEKLICYYPDE